MENSCSMVVLQQDLGNTTWVTMAGLGIVLP